MNKLLSSLPQLSLFVVILALLKLFLYYNNFNIPIKYYIGLSELALQVADDLFILIPIVFFMYFINLDTESKQKKIIDELNSDEVVRPITKEISKGKVRSFLDKVMPYVLMVFFIFVLVGGPIFILFNSKTYAERILGISFLILDAYFVVFLTQNEKLEKLVTAKGMTLSIFTVIFLFMFVIFTTGEIERVEKGAYKGTKIITTDSTYISTDTAFYIGQTSSYVFFYNKSDKHTTILPANEIKKIELYSK